MKISVWQRHYVNNEESLNDLKGIVQRTINATQKKPHISQTVFIQYPKDINSGIKEEIIKQKSRLVEKNISEISSNGYGAGFAWYNSMFNFLGEKSAYRSQVKEKPAGFTKVLVDGHEYSIDDSDVLDGIEEISKVLIESEELFGISARDKIILAKEPKLESSRNIEEMYHARTMGNIKISNPLGIKLIKVPRCYQIFGDPIPGLYEVNTDSPKFMEFLNVCSESCLKADLNGYAGDPYAAMKASTLSKTVPSILIPNRVNPPGPFKLEDIKKKSIELGKTDIALRYFEAVSDKHFKEKLAEEFTEELVNKVTEMILEGLKEGMSGENYKMK